MHIAHFTTRRPVATAMFFLAVVLIGVVSFIRLPVNCGRLLAVRLLVRSSNYACRLIEMDETLTI